MKKSYRIKKEKDFQTIIQAKQSFANRNFIVYHLENPKNTHYRVGLSVGKKIGNAVTRNRVKRLIRQSLFELTEIIKSDQDFIVIARPNIVGLSQKDVKSNLEHVLKLANLIK
ncbi:ribonuclease P protein component [Vagococcus vulneris]|uniref:Ribonuclease P protein component n=1 Tax=Vagococcus vulneris TaxID=1977869 RepID=A0A429ZTZ7_9ENTE|nr:ribonuclease P protein component [Vagococcus vulneris]RST97143.1 ribonuclease P protein component [Vagococcus vulneris]